MKLMNRIVVVALGLTVSQTSMAQLFEGSFSLGATLGITANDQGDINELQRRANARATISTSSLGNAWEFAGIFQYRYNGSFLALQLRPTYFFQSEDGTDSGGAKYEYGVSGYTVFPVAKFHMLESDSIKFYSQLGIGYGVASGVIQEDTAKVEFSGGDLGYMAGLGAEFCFLKSHCVMIEGNYRFLEIDRVTSDSSSGTFASGSISQATGEVEYDNKDLAVDLSGIQGFVGYIFHME